MIFATNATMAVTSALAPLVVGRTRTGPAPLRLIGVLLSAASSVGRRSWAGLTPRHRESDTTVHQGRITKQGSRPVRRAAVEAVQRVPGHTRLGQIRDQVGAQRGRNIRRRRRRPGR